MKEHIKGLYQKVSEKYSKTSDGFHFDYFELKDGELYYKGKSTPLTTRGELKLIKPMEKILGKERLRNLGFVIPRGKVTAWEVVMLNRVEEKLPSASEVAKTDDRAPRDCEKHEGLNHTIRRAGNVTHAGAFGVG